MCFMYDGPMKINMLNEDQLQLASNNSNLKIIYHLVTTGYRDVKFELRLCDSHEPKQTRKQCQTHKQCQIASYIANNNKLVS